MSNKKKIVKKKNKKDVIIIIAVVLIAIIVVALFISNQNKAAVNEPAATQSAVAASNNDDPNSSGSSKEEEGITIQKSEITEKATFIPYKSGNVEMEIVTVKALDGTIRTAFNTCQVCFDSGRGYYVQENDELVCQNCGNRFKISQVEKEKNGCNPVPILAEDKTEYDQTIFIAADYLNGYKDLFKK